MDIFGNQGEDLRAWRPQKGMSIPCGEKSRGGSFDPPALSLNHLHKCRPVLRLEVSRASHQHLGTVFLAGGAGGSIHAAVHLNQAVGVDVVHPFPQLLDLGHLVFHELLTAETGLHGHDQNHVALFEIRNRRLGRGLGLQDDAGLAAQGANLVHSLQSILGLVGFDVDGQPVCTGLDEILHIPDGPVNHQMDVQGQVGHRPQGLNHGDADGDVGNENAVHYGHMDPIGAVFLDIVDVTLQIRKIRRQDGRGKLCHKKASFGDEDSIFL